MSKMKESIAITYKGYQLMLHLSPRLFWFSLIQGFFEAIYPFLPFFFTSRILNILLDGDSNNTLFYWVLGALITTYFSSIIANGLAHYRASLIWDALDRKNMLLNNKIIYMDYELIENSEIHDMLSTIKQSENTGGLGMLLLFDDTKDYALQIFSLLLSAVFLWDLFSSTAQQIIIPFNADSPWILVGLATGLIVFLLLAIVLNQKAKHRIMSLLLKGGIWINNTGDFFFSQLLDYNSGKEIRLYQQQPIYQNAMDRMSEYTKELTTGLYKGRTQTTIIVQVMSYLLLASGYMVLIIKAVNGAILPGLVVQYAGAFSLFLQTFPNLIGSIQDLINNEEALKRLFKFLDLKSNRHEGTLPVEKRMDNEYTLEVRNVSFAYPDTEERVLKNVSLTFNIGEKLAIVGMNGSGKTTLIKLICRLYDPSEGAILLNGIDIRKYNYQEYLRLLSVVFQDFHLYAFQLGKNIAASSQVDEERAELALEKSGFKTRFTALKEGLNTYLYKNYDESGIEFSGGEAQKTAMARALYKDAPIVILDEPTAALDPISESEIYESFSEVVGNRTAIYISHRLSSCRFCDRIAVFDRGELVQLGEHDELVQVTDGKYAELWQAQAQYYQKDNKAKTQGPVLA